MEENKLRNNELEQLKTYKKFVLIELTDAHSKGENVEPILEELCKVMDEIEKEEKSNNQ